MQKEQNKAQTFTLSEEGIALIKKEMARYETKLSCLIPGLYQIQKEKGWISPEAVQWLSQQTGIPESHIQEVLMFYTLFNRKPVGKLHVQVCCNVSCFMQGGAELVKRICEAFQVKEGEVSTDGNWTVSRVECLGACDLAPAMQVNDQYLGKLKGERAIHVLRGLK
ncbi:MAG: NAD(P)H-dependent oxidoreductase subunit E [Bdellovibrionales bacterium]|nr:NAD(P)H-dependent oxidoreductase subunit E [Bdellovibrionales bacterium]